MRHRWAVLLVVTVWAWAVFPRLIQSVLAPKHRASVGVETAPPTALAAMATTGLTLLVIGLALIIVIDCLRDSHPASVGALIAMQTPWFYLAIRDMYANQGPNKAALVYPVVVMALWLLRPRRELVSVLGYLAGFAAVISVLLALAMPSKGIFFNASGSLVTEDKALLPMGILVGFLTHGNLLGQFLVLGLPAVATINNRLHRVVLLGVTTFALVWTASRSSLVALSVAVIAVLSMAVVNPAGRAVVGPLVALVPFVAVVALPLMTHDPEAFTNRGRIWAVSLDWFHQSPINGLGANFYDKIGHTSERLAATVFHGHNQFVHAAVTGGLVLVFLYGVQLLAASVRAGRLAAAGQRFPVIYLATLGGTCILEKSLVLVDNTSLFPVVVIPLCLIMFGEVTAGTAAEATDVRRAPIGQVVPSR